MRTFWDRLLNKPIMEKTELIEILKQAARTDIIKHDTIVVVEAVFNIASLQAKDIMIPRLSMDYLDVKDDILTIIDKIIKTSHSRFPVIDKDISNVVGILHTKDLIPFFNNYEKFHFKDVVRQAYFVPENKYLDELMYEMRMRQNHLALIVDEFTNIVGLVTLEMIVEQILGEIEDEHDSVDGEREILAISPTSYRVKGKCKLNKFNLQLNLHWLDQAVETVGGFLIKSLGRIPVAGEILEFDKIQIRIITVDSRKINLMLITIK